MKTIFAMVLCACLCSQMIKAMQADKQPARKNSLLSALSQKLKIEEADDIEAMQLKKSKKKHKKLKKVAQARDYQEYVNDQFRMSTCLTDPKKAKTKYLVDLLAQEL